MQGHLGGEARLPWVGALPHQAPALHALAHTDALQCGEVDEQPLGQGHQARARQVQLLQGAQAREHLRSRPLEPGVAGQVQDLQALQLVEAMGRQLGETLQAAQRQVSEARQPLKGARADGCQRVPVQAQVAAGSGPGGRARRGAGSRPG